MLFKSIGGLQLAAILLASVASLAHGDLVESAQQAASDAAAAVNNAVSPPPQTLSEKLKDSWNKAGQTLQGYADQISAQISKHSKRDAPGDVELASSRPKETSKKIRELCVGSLERQRQHQLRKRYAPSEAPGLAGADADKSEPSHAREVLRNIQLKCAEILGREHEPKRAAAASRSRRQAVANAAAGEKQQPLQQAPLSQVASLLSNGQASLNAFGEQVRNQTATAVQQFQNIRDQLVPKRSKRQIQYPNLQQPQQPSQGSESSPMSGAIKYISDLGQQAQQAQAISQFVQAATQQSGASPAEAGATSSSSGSNVARVLTQLTDLIKSTQNRNERLIESGQRGLETANKQTMEMAKSGQSGVQAALGDLAAGLQRLASNNPNLVPDIKSLYQSVSSKLSSSSAPSAGVASIQSPPAAAAATP